MWPELKKTDLVGFVLIFFLVPGLHCGWSTQAVYGSSGEYTNVPGTLALWHMNEGTGNMIMDASGNGHHGTFTGGHPPTWSAGIHGASGVQLNQDRFPGDAQGTASGVAIAGGNPLSRETFTLQAHFKWDGGSGYLTAGDNVAGWLYRDYYGVEIRAQAYDNNQQYYMKFLNNTNTGWEDLTYHETTVPPSDPDSGRLDAGTWYELTFIREKLGNGTTDARMWIDGTERVSHNFAGIPWDGSDPGFGHVQQSSNWCIPGEIDEARILDYAIVSNGGGLAACGDWGYIAADFDNNCYVTLNDLGHQATEWLSCLGPLDTNISTDGCIDLVDFSHFAEQLGQCSEPTDANCVAGYGQLLRLDSDAYRCDLHIGSGIGDAVGLRWGQLQHKPTGTQYLYPGENPEIFQVYGDSFAIDSTEFNVDNVTCSSQGQVQTCQIDLSYTPHQVGATVTIVTDESDKMRWSLQVHNNAASSRRLQPVFPYMGRIRIGSSLNDNKYFYPWRGGILGAIDCDLLYEYGNFAWMQMITVFNPTEGVGLLTYPEDSSGTFKGMPFKKSYGSWPQTVDKDESYGQVGTVYNENILDRERPHTGDPGIPVDLVSSNAEGIRYAYYYSGHAIAAGASYDLPQTVIRVFPGGWKEALTDYRSWASSWYNHVSTGDPDSHWVKNVFSTVGAHESWYTSGNQYTRNQNMGDPDVFHMEQWAYWYEFNAAREIMQGGVGDYDYNLTWGGLPALAAEVSAIQAKGTRMTLYLNYRQYADESDVFAANGTDWAVMHLPNTYRSYLGDYYLGCQYEPNAWVDHMVQRCGTIVAETGMDGLYLDELVVMQECYNHNHLHYQQDIDQGFSESRASQYLIQARAAMKASNSEAVLMTEHAGSDYFSQFIDSCFDQLYWTRWPLNEQYYDELSINFFRFCFPELKIHFWGPNNDWENRQFFSGVGVVDFPLSTQQIRASQLMKENGDAFASLSPEPIIATHYSKVLANKFPITDKVMYTIYNKDVTDYVDAAILEVDHRADTHYVELYEDENITVNPLGATDELVFSIESGKVLCIGQFPEIIQATINGSNVDVSLAQYQGDEILVAFTNFDNSAYGFGDAVTIPMTNGQGQTPLPLGLGTGTFILKLYRDDLLLDEVVLGGGGPVVPGTMGLWHMDEGSGTTAANEVGGSDFVLGSEFYWTSGSPDTPTSALATPFSTNTYCTSWVNPDDITDQLTVSAWIKPVNVDVSGSYILTMNSKFELRIDPGRKNVHMVVRTPDGVWHQAGAAPLGGSDVTDFQWHHIAGVYDGRQDGSGNANVYLYWEGQLIATDSFPAPPEGQPLFEAPDGTLFIGAANHGSTTSNYMGVIDEVKISNVVLTEF